MAAKRISILKKKENFHACLQGANAIGETQGLKTLRSEARSIENDDFNTNL